MCLYDVYKNGGIDALLRMSYVGSEALLSPEQLSELDTHLRHHLYQSAEAVARWVKERWGVEYIISGMTAVLRQLGYVYKKPKIVRGKAFPIPSNTGRRRLNINGAIEIAGLTGEFGFDPVIDATSGIELFKQIESANPTARVITIYCDNARYYRAKLVSEYLSDSRIRVILLPPILAEP